MRIDGARVPRVIEAPHAGRAKRTPRVYEPEEDEYPIGGYEEEPAAEAGEAAPAGDEALAAPAAEASGTTEEK